MSKKVTQETVMNVLSRIEHPEMLQTNLVELGMIQGIKVKDGNVEVNLALPKLNFPIKSQLITLIKQTIQDVEHDLEVEVVPFEMDEDQKINLQPFPEMPGIVLK